MNYDKEVYEALARNYLPKEALKLADDIEKMYSEDVPIGDVADMIRKLVAELDKQGDPVAWMSPDGKVSQTEGRLFYIPLYTTAQTKPLSDVEIMDIYYSVWNRPMEMEDIEKADITFARAIEERHEIK